MSEPLRNLGAITLFVEDAQRSKAFYERVLDAEVVHEDDDAVAFRLENTILNLLRRPAAHELVEPARVAEAGSGSSFQLTVWVEDLDAVRAELEWRGVGLNNGPVDRPWGVRTATIADPDGHVWEVAQPLDQSG
jgi:catechol 2,3-dioxygenase-like lactoylglutathione lyase family enzyme